MGRLMVIIIVSLWVIPIAFVVNRLVPESYMDEIFHIPQAQRYCSGDFKSWDPMITTPPGLYYLSLPYVATLFPALFLSQQVSSISEVCYPAVLRSLNGLLAIVCSILLYDIIKEVQPAVSRRRATFYAVVLALYPINWFFTYLYYTDVASLAIFLSMHLTCLKKRYWISALFGAMAVMLRQTNIIWMLFVTCNGVIDLTMSHRRKGWSVDSSQSPEAQKIPILKNHFLANPGLRKRNPRGISNAADNSESRKFNVSTSYHHGFLDEIKCILSNSWDLKGHLLLSFTPFLLVLVAFVIFVYWNGSIVLGAKEAHTVSPHLAQILYFAAVSCLASAPFHFSIGQASAMLHGMWKNKPLSFCIGFLALIASLFAIHFFSIAHPYLLADNRHYTFYLWRKVVNGHWSIKYLLVPLYVYSWASICITLGKTQKKIWVLAYFLACAAVLIPAPLIEFRYYTIPFYIMMLHSGNFDEDYKWAIMGAAYLAVNVFTMSTFLFRPFSWEHEAGTQRFIW